MRRDHREPPLGLAFGAQRLKAVRKLLGDKAGRKAPLAPARMLHQRGEERNVVPDAIDDEGVERIGLRLDRGEPVRRVGHEFGDHRIVMDRDLSALEDAGVVADRDAMFGPLRRRAISHQTPGRRQEATRRIFA